MGANKAPFFVPARGLVCNRYSNYIGIYAIDIYTSSGMADTLNPRKALAGLFAAQGMTQKKALISAGYSHHTARTPKSHGLSAQECLSEAAKLDSTGVVSRLPRLIRSKLERAIEDTDADSANLLRLVRAADHIERYHGAGADQERERNASSARTIVERLAYVDKLTIVAREQGLIPGSIGESAIDVHATDIDTHPVIKTDAAQVVDAQGVAADASDNRSYVNPPKTPVSTPDRPDPADF